MVDTFAMGIRVGNWGPAIMLPAHRPLTLALAPADDPDAVATLAPHVPGLPPRLVAEDLSELVVSDGGGRRVLRVRRPSGRVDRDLGRPLPSTTGWALKLQGPQGLLKLYSRGEGFPSDELLEAVVTRLVGPAPVE